LKIRLVAQVFTGRDTIDTIPARDVDILILDLFLHDLDGICVLDFIGKLSEDRRPLVFVTTALADDRLLQVIKDRVIYCFTKPLKYAEFSSVCLSFCAYTSAKRKRRTRWWTYRKPDRFRIRAIGVPALLKGYYYLRMHSHLRHERVPVD
jgi:CheY-like chemotaxis protein